MLASWEMRWLCKGKTIKRWLVALVPKHNASGKNLVAIAKQCPPFSKPGLVKLASEQLLKMLGLNAWGVGSVPRDAASRMEKDEDLQGMIRSTRCVYARQLKTAWDLKN
jgi:hypothetical protein